MADPLSKPISTFDFYKLSIKLLTDKWMLWSRYLIADEHILKKAQKMIKEANKQSAKLLKAYEKYKGSEEIDPAKELAELQGIIRRYEELVGKKTDLPNDAPALLKYAAALEAEFDEKAQNGAERQATVFSGAVQLWFHTGWSSEVS